MNDLDTAAQLAFQATTAVQQWCITVMTAVDSQLEQSGNVSTAKLRPLGGWLGGWPGLDLPAWVGLGVAAKSTIWGATAAPPAQGGYFLISFRSGDGKPWQLQVKWGRFKDVHRPRGKFKVLDIYRELLDLVNRGGPGHLSSPRVSGTATMKARSLLGIADRSLVQQLAEEVAAELAKPHP